MYSGKKRRGTYNGRGGGRYKLYRSKISYTRELSQRRKWSAVSGFSYKQGGGIPS